MNIEPCTKKPQLAVRFETGTSLIRVRYHCATSHFNCVNLDCVACSIAAEEHGVSESANIGIMIGVIVIFTLNFLLHFSYAVLAFRHVFFRFCNIIG